MTISNISCGGLAVAFLLCAGCVHAQNKAEGTGAAVTKTTVAVKPAPEKKADAEKAAPAATEAPTAKAGEVSAPVKAAVEKGEKEQELIVNADSMEMRMEEHVIDLLGNVLVEDTEMRLTAKKMKVFLDKDNKLRNIEAVGNVMVRKLSDSESATGDTAFYDAAADKVTLRSNCVILQGKNTIKGDEVIYDRKAGTIKLQSAYITIPIKKGDGAGGGFGGLMKKSTRNEQKNNEQKP